MWHAQVPLSCDLAQAVTQLAFLRCYEGVVELPLRKATALDPDNTARLTGEPGRAGREVRCLSAPPSLRAPVLRAIHNYSMYLLSPCMHTWQIPSPVPSFTATSSNSIGGPRKVILCRSSIPFCLVLCTGLLVHVVLQARYENAYVHVMNVLKYLIDPSAGNAGTLPRESSLSDAERKEFLQTLLQVRCPVLPSLATL